MHIAIFLPCWLSANIGHCWIYILAGIGYFIMHAISKFLHLDYQIDNELGTLLSHA